MRHLSNILLVFLILATPGVSQAQPEVAALGSDGTTYRVVEDIYGELFPDGDATTPDRRVLALEVTHPDQETGLILIPETAGIRQTNARHIFFEDASSTIFVLWERWDGIHSALRLASFAQDEWSQVVPIAEDPWTLKGSPQLVLTRDLFELPEAEGGVRTIQRTILHVLWWEETNVEVQAMYRPLILLDGVFQEPGPALALNDLVDPEIAPNGVAPTSMLLHRPVIIPGRDAATAAIVFVDDNHRLTTLEIQVLPTAFGVMAEAVHETVLEAGSQHLPARPDALADIMRGHLIETGHRMNPRDLGFLGDVMRGHLIETGHRIHPRDLGSFADVMRGHLIETGSRIARERLVGSLGETPAFLHVLEMVFPRADEEGNLTNLIGIAPRLEISLPEVPECESWIFPAPNGDRVLLAWLTEENLLRYRESQPDGSWGEVRSLGLSESVSLAQAHELLRKRVAR